ncbi:MAG: formylglycine-generating enzyme family protein [Chloroflexi bacterium]|nr:formylglycine-generating enzyme family protein [Chloroflexota bacterium]
MATKVDQVGADYVWVPPGAGLAGFWLQRTPVTHAQWRAAVDAGVCVAPRRNWAYDDPAMAQHPVTYVGRAQARQYAAWVGGRLPRDAEWTWAAQGGDRRIYPWGRQPPDASRANAANVIGETTPVGSYPAGAGPFGLLDMAGNVWEWVDPDDGGDRPFIARGGAFYTRTRFIACRARLRNGNVGIVYYVGFRVAISDL